MTEESARRTDPGPTDLIVEIRPAPTAEEAEVIAAVVALASALAEAPPEAPAPWAAPGPPSRWAAAGRRAARRGIDGGATGWGRPRGGWTDR